MLAVLLTLLPDAAGASEKSKGSGSAAPRRTVVAVIPPDAPPTYYRDQDSGKASGFAVEMMELIAARAGLDVRYEFETGWNNIIDRVERGDGDLIPGMGISEDRKTHLAFTEPTETVPVAFFVRASIDRLGWKPEGQRIAVIEHSVAHEHLKRNRDIRLVEYSGFVEALFGLLAGKVDAFACPVPTLVRLAQETGVEDRIMVVGRPIVETLRAIAVRKNDTVLTARLNRALEGFVGGPEYQQLYTKWYGKPKPFWTVRSVIMMSLVIGSFISLVAGMTLWRYLTVLKLNRELQSALAEIKTLHGILPICSHCKKIRDDKGSWRQMEAYISEHTTAEFSHGICADCMEKFYPRYAKKRS